MARPVSSDLDFGNAARIVNLPDAASAQQPATKAQLDTKPTATLDTDGTLAANSDSNVASQKATKSFVGASIAALSTVYQAISTALGQIAGLSPSNDDFLQRKAGAWANRTVAQIKTDLGLTGTNSGDQTTVSGNAGTATALQTARNIDGQAFDGTANITVIAPGTHAATSKATPVDADELSLVDSAASNVLKKLTWANLKATLKTYLDTLYQPVAAALTSWAAITRASGFDTFVATPNSTNLRALLTDETGTGAAVFAGGALGSATATTQSARDNSTKVATTAYVDASSGLVLLASGSVASAASLDLVLTSYTGYRGLLIKLSGLVPATSGAIFLCRLSTDGGATYIATSSYGYTGYITFVNTTSGLSGFGGNTNPGQSPQTSISTSIAQAATAAKGGFFDVELRGQSQTGFDPTISIKGGVYYSTNNDFGEVDIFGTIQSAQDTDAIRFLYSSGNISSCRYAIYGYN